MADSHVEISKSSHRIRSVAFLSDEDELVILPISDANFAVRERSSMIHPAADHFAPFLREGGDICCRIVPQIAFYALGRRLGPDCRFESHVRRQQKMIGRAIFSKRSFIKAIGAAFPITAITTIFRRVDGATCSTDEVSTLAAKLQTYGVLLSKGLIWIALPLPASSVLQFPVVAVNDFCSCTTNSATGLTNEATGVVSDYRRPLPSTNFGFLSTIMSDVGRAPSPASEANNATLGHAKGTYTTHRFAVAAQWQT